MDQTRTIAATFNSIATIEGAGVHLKRAFGYHNVPLFDPFLLLDDFHSSHPDDYIAGFPWHPHRGIETVSYILHGKLNHGDSMGNKGTISDGDVQWMTAGSGIIHQEMPQKVPGELQGFQLWINLPSTHKMTNPRYQDISHSDIPETVVGDNIAVRVICGSINAVHGPVKDIVISPQFFDFSMPPQTQYRFTLESEHTAFVYGIEGVLFDKENLSIEKEQVGLLTKGSTIHFITKDKPARFLFISGKPIDEPIAWQGPIVMNTNLELEQAFDEYQRGTFIKS